MALEWERSDWSDFLLMMSFSVIKSSFIVHPEGKCEPGSVSAWPWEYSHLLYGCVSQGLGTTEFTNLIGWNRYWKRSGFSHLDRHLDRLHFAVKKLQTKMQKYWLFTFNNIYLWKCQKTWWEKRERGRANFGRIKLGSSPFASKMSASTNQLY